MTAIKATSLMTALVLTGEAKVAEFAAEAVRLSIPFTVEPLPDDKWLFTTKREHRQLIQELDRRLSLTYGEDRGPFDNYQMFSREGNDACEALVAQIVGDGQAGKVTRLTLDEAKEAGMKKIGETHLEVGDTEPDGEICHQLNIRLCGPLRWQEYGRWTG
jgi:MarR-like DNA-binding transcriptional regulator SgrR of sgrS sRNA